MAEACDQLAAIKTTFRTESAAIQRFGNQPRPLLLAKAIIIHLGLLELEMEVQSVGRGMIENDAPLIEFRTVIMVLVAALDEWPDVVAIATGVVRQEGESVQALARKVIQRPDQPLALAPLPSRITGLPVGYVWFVFVKRLRRRCLPRSRLALATRLCAVEIGICQQSLRRISARLQEILLRADELQVMSAHIP